MIQALCKPTIGSTPATKLKLTASGICARATVTPDKICGWLWRSQPQWTVATSDSDRMLFQHVTSPTGQGKDYESSLLSLL